MSTVTQEIQRLQTSKAAIKAAIEAKGVTVGNGTIDTYADKVALIDEWVAPADWIQLEEPADNEILLLASDINPYYAFVVNVTGGYTVNWGDGTVDNWAKGATASHTYTVGAGQACSRGYTTFKIRIYAQNVANQITYFGVGLGNSKIKNFFALLWAKFGTTGLTSLARSFYNWTEPGYICPYIESVELPNSLLSCTDYDRMCNLCSNLINVKMPVNYTTSTIESFAYAFSDCSNLKKFVLKGNLIKIALMDGAFRYTPLRKLELPLTISGCSNYNRLLWGALLTELKIWEIDTVCNCSNAFRNMPYVTEIVFPDSWNGKISELGSGFANDYSLRKLILPTTVHSSFSSSSFQELCYNCQKLPTVTLPTVQTVMTTFLRSFTNCYKLRAINNMQPFNGVTNQGNAFDYCVVLSTLNNTDQFGDTTTGVDLTSGYAGCYSLNPAGGLRVRNKITGRFVLAGVDVNNRAALQALLFTNPAAVSTWAGSSPQIDVSYCSMDATALNALFTSIIATSASFSGKTIRITGNPGAATCDTTIITNAGGTVNKTT